MYNTVSVIDNEDLLQQYKDTKNIGIRNEIVTRYSYIAKTIAIQMRGVYSQYAEIDDIINQGIITLIECIDRYDFQRGVKFETYASLRIRGSIIDFVRKQDWIPRRVRKLSKEIDEAQKFLSNKLMRDASNKEIADYMQITEKQLHKYTSEVFGSTVISFEGVLQDISQLFMKNVEISDENNPESELFKKELHNTLRDSIKELREKEQIVISLYYYENLKFADISDILEVSESRVCQIHGKAIKKIREKMKKYMVG